MLSKEQMKQKKLELIQYVIKTSGYEADKYVNNILAKGMTCDTCLDNATCLMAYDGYNTDGDCIMLK